jgi:hypothetical protein
VVKFSVKPAAVLAVITILAILVVAEVVALADANHFPPGPVAIPGNVNLHPPQIPLPKSKLPAHLLFDVGNPVPDHGSASPKSLTPGIYETPPYAIILRIPNSTADNYVLRNLAPSPMRIRKL